jgi:hypothetical protein
MRSRELPQPLLPTSSVPPEKPRNLMKETYAKIFTYLGAFCIIYTALDIIGLWKLLIAKDSTK